MKPSIQKLQKFFKLEAQRGFDNHAVMGGLERMLDWWSAEARADGLPDDLITLIEARIRDYARLTQKSRSETLQGLWRRIQRGDSDIPPEEKIDAERPAQISPTEIATDDTPKLAAPPQAAPAPETSTQAVVEEPATPQEGAPETAWRQPEAPPSVDSDEAVGVSFAPIPVPVNLPPAVDPSALNAPLTVVQGVGPKLAEMLHRLGMVTLRDMLYYFPRRYDDFTRLQPINRLTYGEEVTVIAAVQKVTNRPIQSGRRQMTEAVVGDGTGAMRVTWFNQPWIGKRLQPGMPISLSGKVTQYLGRPVMDNPSWEPLEEEQLSTNRIVPIYRLTEPLKQRWLRRLIYQVVSYWAPRVPDYLPFEVRRSAGLIGLQTALAQTHFPESWEHLKAAQARLAFDEIFLLQLGVQAQKRQWQDRAARIFAEDPDWMQTQMARLPYQLTGAQQRVSADIQGDLASGRPMNRLVQGDVGSGKTVVAALAVTSVAHQGAQSALMAPTSILAEQHYKNLVQLLAAAPIVAADGEEAPPPPPPFEETQIRLMVGATSETEKREIRAGLADGSIKLIIGTHALIEDPVVFQDLQLVIVDEQHRFGVDQRAALRAKGDNPHLLVMTATPIPRSLALTIYGDLDVSVIDELPPGRQPVSTHVLMPRERERAYTLIRGQAQEGRQTFVIYPLIEESEESQTKAAVDEHARLQREVFPKLSLGLLHGRMRPDEKDAVMSDFHQGKYHILVSTTVVEVGVDVPNATVMLIEGANHFGLAQLHQLRGRVGRNAEKSYCLLIPDHPDQAENERLQVMAETNDGFVLAERDLEQRGPGQFLGTRQSGYAELQFANLTDVRLIEKARRHAQVLFEQDPQLIQPENQLLAYALQHSWSGSKGDIS
jgi:ATP-dependent DNA helicase RecG